MAKIIAILALSSATAIVFYKTIITREWRNQGPGEAKSWHWWVVYYNRKDSRLFLPKRTGLGWTINSAQPLAIVLLLLLLVVRNSSGTCHWFCDSRSSTPAWVLNPIRM